MRRRGLIPKQVALWILLVSLPWCGPTRSWDGFAPTAANAWEAAGFVPEEARAWRSAGISPFNARAWKEAAFALPAVQAWQARGFTLGDAVGWQQAGFDPESATSWQKGGYSPASAKENVAVGFTPGDALGWKAAGVLNPSDALKLEEAGFAPLDPPGSGALPWKDYLAREDQSPTSRDERAKRTFQRLSGYPRGRPGYTIGSILPFACGGSDDPSNLQWLAVDKETGNDGTDKPECDRDKILGGKIDRGSFSGFKEGATPSLEGTGSPYTSFPSGPATSGVSGTSSTSGSGKGTPGRLRPPTPPPHH